MLFILLTAFSLASGQEAAKVHNNTGVNDTYKNPERIVNITALQAGSNHYRNGNPGSEANFQLFYNLAIKAAASVPKPDLICFPEYTISGWSYPPENVINSIAENIPGEGYWYKRYTELARKTGIPILGWLLESSNGKLYNTSFMLDGNGNYLGKYRKVQANLGEQTWWGWSQGEQFNLIELEGVKYGISICADMWYPETVRCEELLGADVIIHASIADDMGHLIPARAFDSKIPIVATIFQGGSYAVDDEGKLLGKLKPETADFITFPIKPFKKHIGNKYGGLWDYKKGGQNIRNVNAYSILTSPLTRPPWTDVFMDREGKPQTKEQLLKRFNGRYDANDPGTNSKSEINKSIFEKWQCIEIVLPGPLSDATGIPNPFDVHADVKFISPAGKEYLVPAFFNGDGKGGLTGNIWKVRFSADETGTWNYTSQSSTSSLDNIKGTVTIIPPSTNASGLYRWGRLEKAGTSSDNIRYLKFREGPYWLKAGCDDPENFLGSLNSYNTTAKRKAAIDYLSSRGINSLYIMTNNIDGDGKDVWPWLGENEKDAKENSFGKVRFNIAKMEEWNEVFSYMQSKGMVVYIVLEDDSGWKGYDHARYYRELIARFGYLPGLIFNLNEEYNENYTLPEALELVSLLKKTDPYDHPCGIHNVNRPDNNYIQASQIDFTSIQTGNPGSKDAPGPSDYHNLVLSWIKKCKELSTRTLMVGIDEGRPEEERRIWWSTYLSGGVWEAHVLEPYDRPMEAWNNVWTQLGGARKFMESIPFWVMHPDSSIIKKGKGFCLNNDDCEYAIYLPEGGTLTIELPKGKQYRVSWWNPENSFSGNFQNEMLIKGGIQKLVPPTAGDWAVHINPEGVLRSEINEVPLYGTFEGEINLPGIRDNRFEKFISFTFTSKEHSFNVDGFYNGDDTWCVRFMPDETGVWKYTWSFEGKNGKGQFVCTSGENPKNHGHVKRDPSYPRYLVYDDGTPHYWYGGKWIASVNYGPEIKHNEINWGNNANQTFTQSQNSYVKDHQFIDYLDTIEQYRHNGLLLKNALYPLENDKISWDLEWIRRGEWLVRQMAERGIYCQVNFFDTWSRDREKWFSSNTDGSKQLFNVWDTSEVKAKENYIRTLVARYAGFYNVYWELGNEMEHRPNAGAGFISMANENYIPWIHKYDPYGLPICLSEEIWRKTNVDIGLIHQTNKFPEITTDRNRPIIINELVRGGINQLLYKDSVMRDPSERLAYRRTFWRYFTYGGCGSTEATWLSITEPLNEAALNVIKDQMHLRNFIDKLPASINQMDTDTSFIEKGPGAFRTRGKKGECYVTYFLLEPGAEADEGDIRLRLPDGNFEYKWYNPQTGVFTMPRRVPSGRKPALIQHPAFIEDIVLLVTRAE